MVHEKSAHLLERFMTFHIHTAITRDVNAYATAAILPWKLYILYLTDVQSKTIDTMLLFSDNVPPLEVVVEGDA